MLKINNVPCNYTELFPTEVEFILLHKLIDNKKYRNYFKRNKNNGNYKILDNSAFELGSSLDGELLMKWANLINASEVIVPDSYSNKYETLELKEYFFKKYYNNKYSYMGVVQGNTWEEFTACFVIMNNDDRINVLGLNKLFRYHPEYKKLLRTTTKPIHFLGLNDLKEWIMFSDMDIRSADSRILAKIVTGKEDPWEEHLNKTQIKILNNLINIVEKW